MSEARSVLGVICSFYDSFFEAEKKIADYIMEHKAQAVDMTVGSWQEPAAQATLRYPDFVADAGLRDSRA